MVSLLLAIIYVAFVSLGLPDGILGSAWPSMFRELGVSVSYASVLSMIIAGGTIVSSLFSVKMIRRFGTGLVTTLSVAMTALALLGYSFSGAFWLLCLWSIPYGLGAGSVDAALNNFVALHYKSRHMNWLHCCWGMGAAAGAVHLRPVPLRRARLDPSATGSSARCRWRWCWAWCSCCPPGEKCRPGRARGRRRAKSATCSRS